MSLSSVERPAQRGRRSRARVARQRRRVEILRAGCTSTTRTRPTTRPNRSRSRFRRPPVRRRDRVRGLAGRPPARLARRPRPPREDDRRRDRRSRREPGRSRRGHARLLRLRERAPRAADDPGAVRRHAGPAVAGSSCAPWTCMPTVLDLLGIAVERQARGSEPGAADDRSARRAGARGIRRGDVPALPLRMERPAGAAIRALQVHRGAAAGALRS